MFLNRRLLLDLPRGTLAVLFRFWKARCLFAGTFRKVHWEVSELKLASHGNDGGFHNLAQPWSTADRPEDLPTICSK